MNTRLLLALFLVFSFACKNNPKESAEPSQMDTVMAIHDEVMPKMGTLAKYTAELKAKIDSTEQGQSYEKAMKDLQEANKAMMDWMMGFGERFDSEEILNGKELTPQKQEWLNEEEEKVKRLKEQIYSSIENAEALLSTP